MTAFRTSKGRIEFVIIAVACLVVAISIPERAAEAQEATDIQRLGELTQVILNPLNASTVLQQEVVELTQILHRNGSIRFAAGDDPSQGETRTDEGLALSPAMAAQCAADATRTVIFIRGLHAAIVDALEESQQRPVRVLYVGSGPYALLATPQMTVFSPEMVQFTVMDIHELSVKSARSVIDGLGLSKSVSNYAVVDAHDYQLSREQPPHVIVLEIMTAALESEPQVSITRHLMEQASDAILVPELITVDAYWVDLAKEFAGSSKKHVADSDHRIYLGKVFELSAASVATWKGAGRERLPGGAIQLPDTLSPGYGPMLFTTVQAYKSNVLHAYESGLTAPRTFPDTGPIQNGETLNVFYQLGNHPRLLVEPRPPRME